MNPSRPLSLTLVAWIFILLAASSAWQIISQLCHGRLFLNFGVLFVFIGRGLLQLRPRARDWALAIVFLFWFVLVLCLFFGLFGASVFWSGKAATGWEKAGILLGSGLFYGSILAWMTRVLTRQDIVDLFHPPLPPLTETDFFR